MSNKKDRFLGKRFYYQGVIIEVLENMGTSEDGSTFYRCKVIGKSKGNRKFYRLRYQSLRALTVNKKQAA